MSKTKTLIESQELAKNEALDFQYKELLNEIN